MAEATGTMSTNGRAERNTGLQSGPFDRGPSTATHGRTKSGWSCEDRGSATSSRRLERLKRSVVAPRRCKPRSPWTDSLSLRSRFRRIRPDGPLLQRPDGIATKQSWPTFTRFRSPRRSYEFSSRRNALFCNTVKRGCIVSGEKAAVTSEWWFSVVATRGSNINILTQDENKNGDGRVNKIASMIKEQERDEAIYFRVGC